MYSCIKVDCRLVSSGAIFRSGHQEVDYEHNSLIALSNELIVNCFMEDNFEKTSQLLERICVHMVEHFSNEEKVLYEYRYIELEEHKEIHKELLKSMQYLMEAMYKGELEQIDLAKYIIQEIIIGHIIKYDFRFLNYLQNRFVKGNEEVTMGYIGEVVQQYRVSPRYLYR